MKQEVSDAQKIWQRFPFLTYHGTLEQFAIGSRLYLCSHVVKGRCKESACARCEVAKGFAQLRVEHLHDEVGQGARGVELTSIASRLKVFQNAFVNITKGVAVASIIKLNLVDYVDNLTKQCAILHVLVQVGKCFLHNAL